MKKVFLALCSAALLFTACDNKPKETATESGLWRKDFQQQIQRMTNNLYVLKNASGMEVTIINYGARIVSVMVPDKNGDMKDMVLGFSNIEGYTTYRTDFGASIGRYANRIANAKFEVDRVIHHLRENDGKNTLHGGSDGFQYRMYDITQIDDQTVECRLSSADKDNGFPGNLFVTVTYKLTDDNAIDISYEATTDRTTVINMTNHSYFNLSGDPNNTILDHVVYIDADNFTPTDSELIPTGEIASVKGTPMDFTTPKAIGQDINKTDFLPIEYGKGYDHNWVFNHPGDISNLAAKVVCPSTGISLEVYTDEPGIQMYTGNFLDGTITGKNDVTYQQRAAVCLETQHFPNSPNIPAFPSTELRPGETYTSRCIYKFGVEK